MVLWSSPSVAQDKVIVFNPYETVDWNAEHQKANFHAHTTESDGAQDPAGVIDGYHSHDYNVLALTDHNHVTWPWSEYGRSPEQLDMVPVPGNELSQHDHNLSLFTEYPSPLRTASTDRLHTSIREVGESGGLNVLAHPGRYWEPGDDRVPDDALAKYMGLFYRYDTLVGMEVHNQTDRYPWDRRLWDALLEELMPERPVWGFANDDSHGEHHIGLNASWFPLESLTRSTVREALENGQFYFSTVTTHPEAEQDLDRTPKITDVSYDRDANTLTLAAEVNGTPVDDSQVQWISNRGDVVAEGKSISIDETDGLSTYLRAEIRSDGALTYTQPFGLGAP
jgi:histidinol phosphatase-like PHP family hydrolase